MKEKLTNKFSTRNLILFTILLATNLFLLIKFGEEMDCRNIEAAMLFYLASFFFNIAIWSQIKEHSIKKKAIIWGAILQLLIVWGGFVMEGANSNEPLYGLLSIPVVVVNTLAYVFHRHIQNVKNRAKELQTNK